MFEFISVSCDSNQYNGELHIYIYIFFGGAHCSMARETSLWCGIAPLMVSSLERGRRRVPVYQGLPGEMLYAQSSVGLSRRRTGCGCRFWGAWLYPLKPRWL